MEKYIGAHVSASGGVEKRAVERPRNRGDGFCLIHEEPAAVEGGTADGGEYRTVQRTLRGIRVHASTDIAARQLFD